MAVTKKEAAPFLVRRADVLQKLKANKAWLEQSFKLVRESGDATSDHFSCSDARKWAADNWEAVVEHFKNANNPEQLLSGNWHENYAEGPRAMLEVSLNVFDVPGYPYKKAKVVTDTNIRVLNETVKAAFMSGSDNKGNQTPSRYQKICQYISLFEQTDEQFLDAKFYSDIPGLISDFKQQFEEVQQIN